MTDKAELMKVEEVASMNVIEAQSRAEIDIQIATAKRYPRNVMRFRTDALAIATASEEIAKSCTYSLPRGGKDIKGASIHLALILANEYGNLRVDAKVVEIGESMLTAQALAFDLEKNVAYRTEVKRRITDKQGQRYADDMIVVTANAALSIASRNAIFKVIPRHITEEVYNACCKKITGDLSTEQKLYAKRKEVLDGFLGTYGVTEDMVLDVLGVETINQIKEQGILDLIGLANALKDGDTTVDIVWSKDAKDKSGIQKQAKDIIAATREKMNKAKAAAADKKPEGGKLL